MKLNVSRRCFVRAITYSLALLLTLSSLAVIHGLKAEKYKAMIESDDQHALLELTSMIDNISVVLDKGIYATSPTQLSFLSATLWRESEAAKNSLATLPIDGEPLEKIYRFLSQTGDYAMVLSKKVSGGTALSEDELNNMLSLSQYAHSLGAQLSALERDVTVGGLKITAASDPFSDSRAPTFSDGFNEMENSFENYPQLIYDGPFSDNLLEREPLMLSGKPEISHKEAQKIAADIIGSDLRLSTSHDEISSMPCYVFTASDEDNIRYITAAVSKQGGYPVYYLVSREIGEEQLEHTAAVKKAAEYLKKIGYTSLSDSYYEVSGGICTVNFAHTQDDIICYPDLIKVRVAMDNGEILGFDARGYLTNHRTRSLPPAAISVEEAQAALSPLLTVESSSLALIPTGGTSEALTHEFICRGVHDEGVIVYVNTETGSEENILLLIENNYSVLTR